MSIQLALQILGLTIAIAVIIAQVTVLASDRITKNYFAYKLCYMQMLMQHDASDGFKDMLADIAQRHMDKVL